VKPLTDRQAEILSLLVSGPRYGLQIAEGWEREHPGQRFPLGGLYTTMARMEESGLVTSKLGEATSERGGNRRKYFKITGVGQESLRDYSRRAAQRIGIIESLTGKPSLGAM
jgi:DNA-binding PadR family transcriptional regulator